MSKLSERQRLVLTIAVTVLLTGGLLALIIKDRSEIDTTNDEIAGLDARIKVAEVEIAKTKNREDNVLVYRAVEERELAVLPTKQAIANFHRDLSTFLAQAGLTFQELPESTPTESNLAKGIFVTRTVLTCQGISSSLLKFLNMIENDERLVAVKGLKVKAGQRKRQEENTRIIHDIEMHLETYFYNPDTRAVTRNKIAGEEARLQDDTIREAIASFQPERPDSYVLRPSTSRRDPMIDPRRAQPSLDPAELEEAWAAQESIVIDLEKRIHDINEKVEMEKALLDSGDLFRRDRVAREIESLLGETLARIGQVDQLKKVVIPQLALRLEAVRDRVNDLRGRRPPIEQRVTREVAENTLREVRAAFAKGAYNEVATLTAQWSIYIDGKEIDTDAMPAVNGISDLRPKAKIYAEFQAMVPRVTGTIVHPLNPSKSVALINGRPHHTGDRVDNNGAIEVGKIMRESVEFIYREEIIRVSRRSGVAGGKPTMGGATLDALTSMRPR